MQVKGLDVVPRTLVILDESVIGLEMPCSLRHPRRERRKENDSCDFAFRELFGGTVIPVDGDDTGRLRGDGDGASSGERYILQ